MDPALRILLWATVQHPFRMEKKQYNRSKAARSTYSWVPQGHILVCTKGEHARLNVPVRGGRVPVPPSADIVGCDGHHGDHA